MAKSKALIMAEARKKLEDQGLIPILVHIPPEERDRLYRYVISRLKGHMPPQRKKPH